jgi:hypothetical protein
MARLTAAEIMRALRARHPRHEWVFFEEFRAGVGQGPTSESRLDALAINCRPQEGLARVAYEIKTSRADFLVEIKTPLKRRMAVFLSSQFYFVTPKGLVEPHELPPEAGLIEVWEDGNGQMRVETVVEAIWRESEPPNWRFVASLARRVREEEERAGAEGVPASFHEIATLMTEFFRIFPPDRLREAIAQYAGHDGGTYVAELLRKLTTHIDLAAPHVQKLR